jgi:hypothetical protein
MSKPTATRSFYLVVSEDLVPFTQEKRKGFNSFKMQNGMWFNTKARIPASQALQLDYANMVSLKIKELIVAEARKLQHDWYIGVPEYFNRRAYGMYFRKSGYAKNARPKKFARQSGRFRRRNKAFRPHQMSGPFIGDEKYLYRTKGKAIEKKYTQNRRQFPGRMHTGQLRRSLSVTDITADGCLLFVKPCYSSTGGKIDYVNVLMHGARVRSGHPYIPELDRRIKMRNQKWRGIKQSYWLRWQAYFQLKVEATNARLHKRVMDMIAKMGILQQSDLAKVRSGSKKEKNITKDEATRKSRKSKTGPVTPDSPYDKHRDISGYGTVKRDPQVYRNKYGPFNPFKEFGDI